MIDAAVAGSRFLFYAGALFVWGAGAFLSLLVPPGIRPQLWKRLAAARALAVAALLVATLVMLPLRTAVIGGSWEAVTDPAMLVAVITATSIGAAWSVHMLAAVLLAIGPAMLPPGARPAACTVLAGILLTSLSLTGHAAMNSGWIGLLQQVNNVLHLMAGGAWVGALPVILLLLPLLRDDATRSAASTALRRFSNAGHGAVILVAASGVLSTMLITGGFPPAPSSAYRTLLLIKIALVAAMILVAIGNRYLLVPRMRAHPDAARTLAIGTLTEIALVAAVIGLVATFGMMEPDG